MTHMLSHRCIAAGLFGAVLCSANPAWAVNGAQLGGYGIKNAAMGGASIALPLDSLAPANNPAGIAFVAPSASLNLQIFHGESSSQYVIPGNYLENRSTTPSPEAGISWRLDHGISVGLALAGQGVGADYKQPALPVPGAGNAKSNLMIVEFIPTIAWQVTPQLALGAALNLVYQRFEADGVIVPAPVPGGLYPLPTHGTQSATGAGLRVGLLWKIDPSLAVGLNLKTRTPMSRLKGYGDDLLAYSDGRIDIASQYGVGVAWNPTDKVTLAADYLRVQWGDLKVMQDPNGFQWRDQPILRLGGSWAIDDAWTLRAGLSANRGQIDSTNTMQNLLAPSINERAYTAGVSWRLDPKSEFTFGYEFNPRTTLDGTGASTGTSLTSKIQIFMLGYQRSL